MILMLLRTYQPCILGKRQKLQVDHVIFNIGPMFSKEHVYGSKRNGLVCPTWRTYASLNCFTLYHEMLIILNLLILANTCLSSLHYEMIIIYFLCSWWFTSARTFDTLVLQGYPLRMFLFVIATRWNFITIITLGHPTNIGSLLV